MEDRSSRRPRTLVTLMAQRGLTANELSGALISMMARSTRFNQRPDTLMQDRHRQFAEPSCDARPDHTYGSNSDVGSRSRWAGLTSESGPLLMAHVCLSRRSKRIRWWPELKHRRGRDHLPKRWPVAFGVGGHAVSSVWCGHEACVIS